MKFTCNFFCKRSFFDQNQQPLHYVEPLERILRELFHAQSPYKFSSFLAVPETSHFRACPDLYSPTGMCFPSKWSILVLSVQHPPSESRAHVRNWKYWHSLHYKKTWEETKWPFSTFNTIIKKNLLLWTMIRIFSILGKGFPHYSTVCRDSVSASLQFYDRMK